MKNTKSNLALIEAYKRGYWVNDDGHIFRNESPLSNKPDKGYVSFSIRMNGPLTRVSVHRLQAYQKYKKALFEPKIEVRHFNNVSWDNSWENILIGTPHENAMDRPIEQRIKRAQHASAKLRAFTDEQVIKIVADHNDGMSYNGLIKKYGTSKGTLSYFFNKALYVKETGSDKIGLAEMAVSSSLTGSRHQINHDIGIDNTQIAA